MLHSFQHHTTQAADEQVIRRKHLQHL